MKPLLNRWFQADSPLRNRPPETKRAKGLELLERSNDEMENVLGMIQGKPSSSKKRIFNNNGITTRYYAIDPVTGKQTHNNAQITAEAICVLTNKVNFSLEDLDCLVCGTSGADQIFPHQGLMVHGELSFPPCEVASTAGVCCAGVAALKYGYMNV